MNIKDLENAKRECRICHFFFKLNKFNNHSSTLCRACRKFKKKEGYFTIVKKLRPLVHGFSQPNNQPKSADTVVGFPTSTAAQNDVGKSLSRTNSVYDLNLLVT